MVYRELGRQESVVFPATRYVQENPSSQPPYQISLYPKRQSPRLVYVCLTPFDRRLLSLPSMPVKNHSLSIEPCAPKLLSRVILAFFPR